MTRPGIEPRSPGPLANTLTAGPMSRCVCVCVCVCLPNLSALAGRDTRSISKWIGLVWLGWVGFYGISTIEGY